MLRRGDRTQVQTEMVEFIVSRPLLRPSLSKLNIWSFHVVVVQGRQ